MDNNLLSHDDIDECVICLEDIEKSSYYIFNCTHKLHRECFDKYCNYNYDIENNFILCPICRSNINIEIVDNTQNIYTKWFIIKLIGSLSLSSLSISLIMNHL